MTHSIWQWPKSPILSQLSHILLSLLPLYPPFLLKSISQNGFWRYRLLKYLDDRGVRYVYYTPQKNILPCTAGMLKKAYLQVNCLQFVLYIRFIDTKSSLNMGSTSWSHQTIGNVLLIRYTAAPGHSASRYCVPVAQLSQASPIIFPFLVILWCKFNMYISPKMHNCSCIMHFSCHAYYKQSLWFVL